ncbi:hypothetical protein NQ317_013526 [Molorchus minor]|uniref:acid phosphatase n=1 Tax=Molorchus minor TaxID=1323400 RepID=A0ABQ9JX96_9CUCU|nr:hypothetical protein NQ317_013526 [Molorchus minor]
MRGVGVFLVIFLAEFGCGFVVNVKSDDSELVSVAVLFRHGDKTPTTSFPNDPYFNISYWPMGLGQLTKKGKLRQYQLGKWLRNRYSNFLPEEYVSKDVYVRSTDVDRTLMSAAANLAGLYPPTDSETWNKDLRWHPIPIHTVPKGEDQVLYMETECTKFTRLYNAQYNGSFFEDVNKKYADFYKQVSNLTGWDIDDVHFFAQLQSALYVYSNHNSSYLPDWYDSLDKEKMAYLAGLNYVRYTFTQELKRLGAGPFFDYLTGHFDRMVEDAEAGPKILMLSGHESTVAAALNVMGVFDYKAPEFASSVIWELRKTSLGVFYVNVFYKKNSSMEVPEKLELEACSFDCFYESYKKGLQPISLNMTVWEAECLG